MAIYKGDMIIVDGKVVQGEPMTGDEIRMPYRIANSITTDGVTYVFSHMDGNEAVYVKGGTPPAPVRPLVQASHPEGGNDSVRTIQRSELPPGAILSPDFVGRFYNVGNRRYRMMQPTTKCDGQYVLVEA